MSGTRRTAKMAVPSNGRPCLFEWTANMFAGGSRGRDGGGIIPAESCLRIQSRDIP